MRENDRSPLHGLINIRKPSGRTSFDIVKELRRFSGEKKVGHAGTLDPAATGVLPVLLGEACKASRFFMETPKEYRAVLRLGYSSDTMDSDGRIEKTGEFRGSKSFLEEIISAFEGEYIHRVPDLSARKFKGKKFCDIKRSGGTPPERHQRSRIYSIKLESYTPPDAGILVSCSSGTYIRTLASDISIAAGTRGYLKSLERSSSGGFSIRESVPPEEWESGFLGLSEALSGFSHVVVNKRAAEGIRRGVQFDSGDIIRTRGDVSDGIFPVFSPGMRAEALGIRENGRYRLIRVFRL